MTKHATWADNLVCMPTGAAQDALTQLQNWCAESPLEVDRLMNVTDTIPEGHAVIDCGAALDCTGEQTAARTAQAIEAKGDGRLPECVDKCQDFRFGAGEPQRADFAVSFLVTLGDRKVKTIMEAFVLPGITPHLVSRRWLSHHKCRLDFDP